MKIYCCYTPAHEVLLNKIFRPSLPETFSLTAHRLEIGGSGDYSSPEFIRCILRKVELVTESIRLHAGETIVWSDVDIRFFNVTPGELSACLGDHDIALQREYCSCDEEGNVGFFVCRASERLARFFDRVGEELRHEPEKLEQYVINKLLREPAPDAISWTCLPNHFYARSHGWPPPRPLALYHANCTSGSGGVSRKIQQFRELNTYLRFRLLMAFAKYLKRRAHSVSRSVSKRLPFR